MSEWLDLMLEEIARKQREQDEALEELDRRKGDSGAGADDTHDRAVDDEPGQAK